MKADVLYHPSVHDTSTTAPSYWEATASHLRPDCPPLVNDERCDVAIIGGGFTGLSAALHLARDHDIDVRLLEAGPMAWGASGRNGGFCCIAATKLSIDEMIRRYGIVEAQRFYAAQVEGAQLVKSLGEDENIDFDRVGDGNFTVAHSPSRVVDLQEEARSLSDHFGIPTRLYTREEFRDIGHDGSEQFGAMHASVGFALHPLKFALGLARAALRHGAHLHGDSPVTDWRRDGADHVLTTLGGRVRAARVIVATNGYYREGLHASLDAGVLPALSNIVTTRPLSDEELAAQAWSTYNPICNTRTLLFYYRLLPDRSLLFGARGDTTGTPRSADVMKAWLVRRLGEVFPGWGDVPVTHFWRGLVCVTRKLAPSVGRLDADPSVWYGFGYHANGVNTAPWTGMRLARAIAGRVRDDEVVPAIMRGLPPRFPLPKLRVWALRGAYLYYKLKDFR